MAKWLKRIQQKYRCKIRLMNSTGKQNGWNHLLPILILKHTLQCLQCVGAGIFPYSAAGVFSHLWYSEEGFKYRLSLSNEIITLPTETVQQEDKVSLMMSSVKLTALMKFLKCSWLSIPISLWGLASRDCKCLKNAFILSMLYRSSFPVFLP